MSWLKGLAGRAEDLLNQIDQNAAVALQKEKKEVNSDSVLTEVKWEEQHSKGRTVGGVLQPTFKSSPSLLNSPMKSLSAMTLQTKRPSNDEELIRFLNGADHLICTKEQQVKEVNGSSDDTSCPPIVIESGTSEQKHNTSQRSSRSGAPQNDRPGMGSSFHDEDLRTENIMLKNELRTVNSEVAQLLQRCKTGEKENWSLQKHISSLQASHVQHSQMLKEKELELAVLQKELEVAHKQAADVGIKLDGVQVENEKLLQSSGEHTRNLEDRLMEREEQLRAAHENQVAVLQARLSTLESENENQITKLRHQLKKLEEEKMDIIQQWEKARVGLVEARCQLDQYRTRAQRILQEKEKLIAELRGQGSMGRSTPIDDTVELELEQLRQERELLREEVSQLSARLQASREELQEMERRLEAGREQASHSIQLLQDSLLEERKRRQAAEEDCRTNSEELRSVRDELSRQRGQLAARVREREAELTRLRAQLTQRPVSPPGTDELESRLHMLTQTLVQKQASLETVTTEKNALRLQLEKMESKHRESLALLHHLQTGVVNMNDTDDAKARVPSFLLESPFDSGMTLHVKRAYSSLDAISIRTGVFLRRYPLARILVMWYMVLLHLWVVLVLFTSTPQPQM